MHRKFNILVHYHDIFMIVHRDFNIPVHEHCDVNDNGIWEAVAVFFGRVTVVGVGYTKSTVGLSWTTLMGHVRS